MILISIIVPIYNAEKTLRRCIDSILNQSYSFFELILVDDGSSDASGEICDQYMRADKRVKVIHQPNAGVSAARNAALNLAIGQYVTFCDSDDYVGTEWLKSFAITVEQCPDLVLQGIKVITTNNWSDRMLPEFAGNTVQEKRNLVELLVAKACLGYSFIKLFCMDIIRINNIRFDSHATFREDEQFVVNYLKYANTFICISIVEYFYFQPSATKKYGGDPYYCLLDILVSLDKIFDGQLPRSICEVYFENIKGSIIVSLLRNELPPLRLLDFYRRMSIIIDRNRSLSDRIVNYLIINSVNHRKFSSILIRLIHFVTAKQ